MKKSKLKSILAIMLSLALMLGLIPADGIVTTAEAAAAFNGEGTETNPYLIESIIDWNNFAGYINNGTSPYAAANVYYKLTADIGTTNPVITMVGNTATHPFKGVFNGNGHTLIVNLSADAMYCAPFRYVDGATIKYLHTAGTVAAGSEIPEDNKDKNKYRTGLIGNTTNTVTIKGCRSSVTITSDLAGDGTHAGFVGVSEGTLNMTDCLFDGTITGQNTTNCGGFVGWRKSNNITLTNCYQNGTFALSSSDSGSNTFSRNKSSNLTLTNCYFHTALNGDGGQSAISDNGKSASDLVKKLGQGWEVVDDKAVPVKPNNLAVADIEGLQSVYTYTGSAIAISYTVKAADGAVLTKGTGYNVTYTVNGQTTDSITEPGTYVLNFTGINGYNGTKSVTFNVIRQLTGTGTDSNPYLIHNASDFGSFAYMVNNNVGVDSYYKLDDDYDDSIAIIDMVGSSDHKFAGHFDGNGKTIRVSYGSEDSPISVQNAAPFLFLDGASIENLTVIGTIYTSNKYAAGIAAHTYGTTSITNCISSVTINSNTSGDGTHGGFVAVNEGSATLTFDNCKFDGSMLGSSTHSCGGFVGYNSGTSVSYNSCIFSPEDITISESNSATFQRNGTPNLTNTYATRMFGAKQGTIVYKTYSDNLLASKVTAAGADYYSPLEIKDFKDYYMINDDNGISLSDYTVTDVIQNNAVLQKGTDYTAVIKDEDGHEVTEPIKETGDYTLTLTGNTGNGYYGVKVLPFSVSSNVLKGKGTESEPYLIGNAAEWAVFAQLVLDGEDYAGKYLKMTADITTQVMVGTNEHRFKGTFDGNGHTLTFNITTDESNIAPFRYAEDASFKKLHVDGNITLTCSGYATFAYAAGLVSNAYGNIAVDLCHSSVVICSKNQLYICGSGGFIGKAATESSVTINNCLSEAKFNGLAFLGGFIGDANDSGNVLLKNCLFAGEIERDNYYNYTHVVLATRSFEPDNCYYITEGIATKEEIKKQGTKTSAMGAELASLLGSSWIVIDGKVVPLADDKDMRSLSLSGLKPFYLYTGNAYEISPVLKDINGKVLGTEDYTAVLTKGGVETASVKEKGNYTITFTGKGDYHSTLSYSFVVGDPVSVTDSLTKFEDDLTYKVTRDVTFESRITTGKNVTLILGEGNTLTAKKGIGVNEGNSLTIEGTGTLYAGTTTTDGSESLCDWSAAAIGHDDAGGTGTSSSGLITINDGTIYAVGGGSAAAIGGAFHGAGKVIINGGNVTVKSIDGAGIGGGSYSDRGEGSSVTINGGTINVTVKNGAGIGEGQYGEEGSVTINGGTINVNAHCHPIGGAGSTNTTAVTLDYHSTDDRITLSVDKVEDYKMPGVVTIAEGKTFYNQDKGVILTGTITDKDQLLGTLIPYTGTDIYDVTFKPANGSDSIVKKIPKGKTVIAPKDPSLEGYSFTGWYTAENELFDLTTPIAGDITLTAHYKKIHTVTFDTDGGSAVAERKVIDGENLQAAEIEIPVKAHYVFSKWQLNEKDYNLGSAVTENITLKAVWTLLPEVAYIDENGEEKSDGAYTLDDTMTTLKDNWYAVKGSVSFEGRITVEGDVTLILCDGASLSCKGITVKAGNSLTIYAQKLGSGSLSAVVASNTNNAGIGSTTNYHCGDIAICGGHILAQGSNGGAGIGGAVRQYGGRISLLGGQIIAKTGYVYENYKKVGIGAGSPGGITNIEDELKENTSITISLKNPTDYITNDGRYLGKITLHNEAEDLVTADGSTASESNIDCTTISKRSESVSTWNDLKYRLANGGNVKLGGDIEQPVSETVTDYLEVSSGKEAVLDLNGHTITGSNIKQNVIRIYGTLTIMDSSENKTGSITASNTECEGISVGPSGYLYLLGGNISKFYCGITNGGTFNMTGGTIEASIGSGVYNSGSMVMTGGNILNNKNGGIKNSTNGTLTIGGGAVIERNGSTGVENKGSLTMEGGTIRLNNSVGVHNNSIFVMTDGSITGNIGSKDTIMAGGVHNNYEGSFTMTGGSITDNCYNNQNIAQYNKAGGVYNNNTASMTVGGSARITDNYTLDAEGNKTYQNVLLYSQIIDVSDTLSNDAKIGVSYEDEWVNNNSNFNFKAMTTGLKGKGTKDNFVSDHSDFAIGTDDNGEAVIARKITVHFQDYYSNKKLTNQEDGEALWNLDYVLPQYIEEDIPESEEFYCWIHKSRGNEYAPGATVRFNEIDPVVYLMTKSKPCIYFYQSEVSSSDKKVYVSMGSQYTLPECSYTAPDGKAFAGWRLDNDTEHLHQPGETIVVNEKSYDLYAIWKDVPHTVTVYSRTKDSAESVADISISPESDSNSYLPGASVKVTAPDLNDRGLQFLGWYPVTKVTDSKAEEYDGDNPYTGGLSYTFTMNREDVAMTAVYKPYDNAVVKVSGLDGAKYHTEENTTGRATGSETVTRGRTLKLIAEEDRVFQWQNESGRVLGTGRSVDVTVIGNTEITLIYRSADNTKSYVRFVSDYGQVLAVGLYGQNDTIVYPSNPLKYGYNFSHWAFDTSIEPNTETVADEAAIKAKLQTLQTGMDLTLHPVYEKSVRTGLFHILHRVKDENGSDGFGDILYNKDMYAEIGSTMTLVADEHSGYKFAYWVRIGEGTNAVPEIMGYDEKLFV
jgi:uncharacterized repeat protein (TIGR02543 family)